MKFWQKRRAQKSIDAPSNSEDAFDPAIWKDKQDILQLFHISDRTLQRWREKNLVGMRKYNKKFFYNLQDVERLFAEDSANREEELRKWPFSPLWTAVVGIDLVLFMVSETFFVALLYIAFTLIVALPAQIIISIQKYRRGKKA